MPKIIAYTKLEGDHIIRIDNIAVTVDNVEEWCKLMGWHAIFTEDKQRWDMQSKVWSVVDINQPADSPDTIAINRIAMLQEKHMALCDMTEGNIRERIALVCEFSQRAVTILEQIRIAHRAAERLFIEDSRRELDKLVNKRDNGPDAN